MAYSFPVLGRHGPHVPVEDIRNGVRFLAGLPSFLRRPLGIAEARATLARRLGQREADFLTLARSAGHPGGPGIYRELLELAGCTVGDLEKLVHAEGVEGALQVLYRRGVYLTVDEFKGRRPVVRGSTVLEVRHERLRMSTSAARVPAHSGGSRSAGTPVPIDFGFVRDCAVNRLLMFEAWGGSNWLHGYWGVLGGVALVRILEYSIIGPPPRWFSQVDPSDPSLHSRYRWSSRALRWGSALANVPLSPPEHVPLDDPRPIIRWMLDVLGSGRTPNLHTYASSAVRLCQSAIEAGISLRGVRLTLVGEPTTAARLDVIRKAGAEGMPMYSSVEEGNIAFACMAPEAVDDLHLFHDFHAVIQAAADDANRVLPAGALLVSSLRPTVPFVLLNVSMGDQAVMRRRACGCPLEQVGWSTHLHTIRSFDKLTAGGMTFLDADVIRVLEDVLPRRFGGGPTDYQLVEEEGPDGQPRLRLLVHPALGELDGEAVGDAFLTAVGSASQAEHVMELKWRAAGLLRVERSAPRVTRVGKILHLHQERH